MQSFIDFIRQENSFIKAIFLMLFAIPITFIFQLLFYFIINIWMNISNKKTNRSDKNMDKKIAN